MPNCPICDTTVKAEDYIEIYISDWNKREYKLYYCSKCGLQWWEPLKIETKFYEEEGETSYELIHKGVRDLQNWHKPFLKKFPFRKGRLLDIGCGDGVFIFYAKNLGFEVWGIDLDKKSIKVAKERYKLKNVYAMSLEEFVEFAKEKSLKFDVITFFEVLEHQDKPQEFIQNVKKLLKPEGYIAGTVPNRECFFIKLYRGKLEKTDFPPHHFIRFSKGVIKTFLEKNGFSVAVEDTKSLNELATLLELFFIGKYTFQLKKRLRTKIYASENTKNFKPFKKLLFKNLKVFRTLIFSPFSVFIYPFVEGAHIYFQGKLKQ